MKKVNILGKRITEQLKLVRNLGAVGFSRKGLGDRIPCRGNDVNTMRKHKA